MRFVSLAPQPCTLSRYVEFWSALYKDPLEQLYKMHIGQPLRRESVLALFQWKNGRRLSDQKLRSVLRNYVESPPRLPKSNDRTELIAFVSGGGGAIWRIFWLHCNRPASFPIFDQHVYRSMTFLRDGTPIELRGNDRFKAEVYWDEYLPFHRKLKYPDRKRLDEALWAHGKFLSRYSV